MFSTTDKRALSTETWRIYHDAVDQLRLSEVKKGLPDGIILYQKITDEAMRERTGEEEMRLLYPERVLAHVRTYIFPQKFLDGVYRFIGEGKLDLATSEQRFPKPDLHIALQPVQYDSAAIEISLRENEDRILSYSLLRQFMAQKRAMGPVYGLIRKGCQSDAWAVVAFDRNTPADFDPIKGVGIIPSVRAEQPVITADVKKRALAVCSWTLLRLYPEQYKTGYAICVFGLGRCDNSDLARAAEFALFDTLANWFQNLSDREILLNAPYRVFKMLRARIGLQAKVPFLEDTLDDDTFLADNREEDLLNPGPYSRISYWVPWGIAATLPDRP